MANESFDKRLELFLLLHIVLFVSKQTNSEHNCFLISAFFSISQFPDHAQKEPRRTGPISHVTRAPAMTTEITSSAVRSSTTSSAHRKKR